MRSAAPARLLFAACAVILPLGALAVACNAGGELAYTSALPAGSEGGVLPDDAGRSVADSEVDALPRQNDGAIAPTSSAPLPCSGFDAGCDPTAGQGCCLKGGANDGTSNACFEQARVFGGNACNDPGDVFLGCLSSDSDSACCWEPGKNTRFRASCTGGPEACDPLAATGAVCTLGGACTAIVCKGVTVGYCGSGAPPCQP